MASKIQSHHVYVAITPYKVDGSSAEEFNELDVMTAYDDRRHHFYVCLHAGWKSSYGSHGCIIMGHDDPLTAPKYVIVKDAPRNSQATINEIGAALEMARDAIAWLFNHRDWQRLYAAVRNIALNGYTEKYRQQMEPLMNNTNNQNSEDNTMRLNMDANNNETKNVAMQPQVNNPIEDAQAVEITTEADVQEVDDIAPKVTKRVEPKEEPKPQAVTVPLSDHGTLVVGGVPKPAMPQRDKNGKFLKKGSAPSSRPSEASGEISRQARDDNQLTKVQLVVYKTKKGADAPMIVGFSGEDDPRWKKLFDAKPKWVSAGYRRDLEGNKAFHLLFGTKYMAVAKALAEAYNTDDRKAWEAAEQACADNYNGIVSGFKAEKEARKAERAAAREAAKPAEPAPKCYTNEDVAAMLRKVMAGGDVPEDIKKLLKAA